MFMNFEHNLICIVQFMNKNSKDKEIDLDILRYLSKSLKCISKRNYPSRMGLSLNKFLIKALIKKGLIKMKNFSKNQSKIKYIYILTPKEIINKIDLTKKFMERKMKEYDDLKNDLKE